MKFQFSNRASANLASPLVAEATQLTLAPGTGARFPAATPDLPIQVTVVSINGASEIMRCHNRSGDVLQDLWRGQENSAVGTFDTGSLVELRVTAEVLNNFLTTAGGTLSGDLNIQGHYLVASDIIGAPTIDYVKTHAVYPLDGNFNGAVEVLNGGVHPRINGASILTTTLLSGAVFLWWGRLDQLPSWLKVCDGSLGTPDLRARFPLGADGDWNLGERGGDFQRPTYGAGAHNHDGATQLTQLGSFNLPGLAGASINVTKIKIKQGGQDNPVDTTVVSNVTGGSVSYSGTPTHAHGINFVGDHQHLIDTVPPYVKLHYVMFRSFQVN